MKLKMKKTLVYEPDEVDAATDEATIVELIVESIQNGCWRWATSVVAIEDSIVTLANGDEMHVSKMRRVQ